MSLDELLNGVDQLLSLPEAVIRANELLDSNQSSIDEIAEVITHDPALSAQLLKLVNSAFYGFPGKVDTVSKAIGLIGTDELRSMIMASSATSIFNQISPDLIDMNSFWYRSVFCGLIAKRLAVATGVSKKGEVQFLTGLFHEVGRLVLFNQLPEKAELILSKSKTAKCPVEELEQVLLGFTSADIGAKLLENWRLPNVLWQPIKHQYKPELAEENRDLAEILHLAIKITSNLESDLSDDEPLNIERIETATVADKDLSEHELGLIAMDANRETFEVLNIIYPIDTSIL